MRRSICFCDPNYALVGDQNFCMRAQIWESTTSVLSQQALKILPDFYCDYLRLESRAELSLVAEIPVRISFAPWRKL